VPGEVTTAVTSVGIVGRHVILVTGSPFGTLHMRYLGLQLSPLKYPRIDVIGRALHCTRGCSQFTLYQACRHRNRRLSYSLPGIEEAMACSLRKLVSSNTLLLFIAIVSSQLMPSSTLAQLRLHHYRSPSMALGLVQAPPSSSLSFRLASCCSARLLNA